MTRWLAFALIVGCSQSPSRHRDHDDDDDGGAAGETGPGESGRAQASGGASGRASAGSSGSKASGGDANASGGSGVGGEGAGSSAEGGESASGAGGSNGGAGAGGNNGGAGAGGNNGGAGGNNGGAGGSGGPLAGSGGSSGSSGEAGSGGGSAGSGGSRAGSGGTSGSGNVGCEAAYAVGDDGFVRARALGGICWKGYAYASADSGSSIAPTTFSSCGSNCTLAISGTLNVAVLENDYAGYAQLGFFLNQPAGTSSRGLVTPTGSGIAISYTVNGAPSLRMELTSNSYNWCAELEASSGSYSIPYTAFKTCFTQSPTTYAKEPIATVSLTLPGDTTAHSVSLQLVTLSEY